QRIMQLMYNERSALGCGALETEDSGLTEFGRVCIREIDDCRMVVDLAHAGARTARDAIMFARGTPIISHGNVRALTPHARNAPAEVLRALAERGGVIGITAYAPFCEKAGKGRPTLNDMIDHVAYVAERFGVDHVGVGSDFFEGESWVRFERFFRRRYPSIVGHYNIDTVYADGFGIVDNFAVMPAALRRRGFSEDDTAKVLGGNFLRVFEGGGGVRAGLNGFDSVDVAIVGGGIVGCSAAWRLAERGLKVAVFERGVVASEQSSRAWGFVRQQGRHEAEVPLAAEANRLWIEQ